MSKKLTPRRVLLINDDREMATPLAMLLLVAGYELEMAFDGPSAIVTAETFRPDVCLVDTNVPRLNVYDLSGCLRQLEHEPILANITPFHERDDWDADAEFDLDFTKPSDPTQIVEQLAEFLRIDSPHTSKKVRNVGAAEKAEFPALSRRLGRP